MTSRRANSADGQSPGDRRGNRHRSARPAKRQDDRRPDARRSHPGTGRTTRSSASSGRKGHGKDSSPRTTPRTLQPRHRRKVLLAAIVAVAIVGCIVGISAGRGASRTEGASDGEDTASSGRSQISITAMGDCTLGTDSDFDASTNFTSVYDRQGPNYFFSNVLPYTSSDDLSIANFEGTLTESDDAVEKSYNFKGPASYGQILVDGDIEAVNLANNHAHDFGEAGYEDTIAALDQHGIANFGYERTSTVQVNDIKVGLFGINALNDPEEAASLMQQDIVSLQDDGCAAIIGVFHWGVEGQHMPDAEQVNLAHAAIDSGCDLVLGSHPHVLQGIERYNGRYIVYSLGNFVFGGNKNPSDKDTMIFQQTFTFENGELVVDEETQRDVDIIPCSLSSVSSRNDYQPLPLTGTDGAGVVETINDYSDRLSGEGVTFDSSLDESGKAQLR
jgi:poly-gamma-glutamate capsule biosynthesis protein CapA/YwtB (metallophosphatase superfamily)